MQISRLLEMVYILLEQKTITAKQLSEKFNVSQRTIYRDIDILTLAGIPVYTEKGKGGGINILPEFVINKSILSNQEQHEILLALQTLSNVKSPETGQTLKKLSALFNKNIEDWLLVDFSDWSFTGSSYFEDFKTAILQRRIVDFEYYGTSGEKTKRQIEPIQLWFKQKAWYIKGFCLKRQDIRLFKLNRIKGLKITKTNFSKRNISNNDLDEKITQEPKEELVTLKLKVAPEMSHRIFDEFCEDMTEKQSDGSFIVSVKWRLDHWLYGLILSYGEFIEVLEPEFVRVKIKEKLGKIDKIYS